MMKIQELLETKLGKTIKEASNAEVYYALLHVVQNMAKDKEVPVKKKKIYYISAEFLIVLVVYLLGFSYLYKTYIRG